MDSRSGREISLWLIIGGGPPFHMIAYHYDDTTLGRVAFTGWGQGTTGEATGGQTLSGSFSFSGCVISLERVKLLIFRFHTLVDELTTHLI